MSLIITEVVNTVTITGTQTNLTVQDTLAVPAGGDLTGSYPNPVVSKINGTNPETFVSQNFNATKVFRVVDEYFTGLGSTSSAVASGGAVTTSKTYSPTGDILLDPGTSSGGVATGYIDCQFTANTGVSSLKVLRAKCVVFDAGNQTANGFIFFGSSSATPPANPISSATFAGFTLGGTQSLVNWTVCYNSTLNVPTFVNTGVVAADSDQLLVLIDGVNARFYINDVLVYTKAFTLGESLPTQRMQFTARNLAANASGLAFILDTTQFDIRY